MAHKLIDFSIRVFLCILPLFLFKAYVPSFAQGMFFLMGAFFLYGLSIGAPPVRIIKNNWIKLIYLWLLVCVFFKGNASPQEEWFNFWVSSAGFLYVLAGVLLFVTAYSYARDVKKFIYPIIIVSVLNSIMILCQLSGHDFLWNTMPSVSGFFSSSNQLSQYSVIAFPLIYFINPYLSIIPLFNLIVSGSLSGYLALLIGLIFLGATRQIKKIKVAAILFILTVSFMVTHPVTKISTWLFVSRIPAWEKALNLILKKPYMGYGYQSYNDVAGGNGLAVGYYSEVANPASDWLHNITEFGVPFIIFIGLFLFSLWGKRRNDRITYFLASSVIIGLSLMCWQNMIRYAAVGGTFIIILALLTIKLDVQNARSV